MQPLAVPTLAPAIATWGKEEPTTIRVGRLTHYDAGQVTVEISGTSVTATGVYLSSYVPVLGDYVMLVWQGGSLLILGSLNGEPPDNTIDNWSFEQSAAAVGAPATWGIWTVAGTAVTEVTVLADGFERDARQAAKVTITSVGGTTRLYSERVPVVPGEVWSAAAQVAASGVGTDTVTASLSIAWQSGEADIPPTFISLEQVSIQTFVGNIPFWYQLRGGGAVGSKTAPPGANYARIVLSTTSLAANSALFWDRVTFRKIG